LVAAFFLFLYFVGGVNPFDMDASDLSKTSTLDVIKYSIIAIGTFIVWHLSSRPINDKLTDWVTEQHLVLLSKTKHQPFRGPFFWWALVGDVYFVKLRNDAGEILEAWVYLGYTTPSRIKVVWRTKN